MTQNPARATVPGMVRRQFMNLLTFEVRHRRLPSCALYPWPAYFITAPKHRRWAGGRHQAPG